MKPSAPANANAGTSAAAPSATPATGQPVHPANLALMSIAQLKEEVTSLQQLRRQLQDMGFHSNLAEIDAKLSALEKEQQGRKPGQSLDSALANHRKAVAAKEKAEAALQRAKQAVLEAQEQL